MAPHHTASVDELARNGVLVSLGLQQLSVLPPVSFNSVIHFSPSSVKADAMDTRILVHPRFPDLVVRFLEHKVRYGSSIEKQLYGDGSWTWRRQVARLVEKRALVFLGPGDSTVLRDGTHLSSCRREWDRVGTEDECQNRSLFLTDYLSYDEIMLSSLIAVSGPSHFINQGDRYNSGERADEGTYEPRGVIVGLVGARFERADRMDAVHVLPSVQPPRQDLRLSRLFQTFFGAVKDPHAGFDVDMYKARMRITIDILLLEAHDRARAQNKQAYVYLVGLGLGVWQHNDKQSEYYVGAVISALEQLGPRLAHVATLDLAWISVCNELQGLVRHVAQRFGINAIFTRRNPAERLQSAECNQLLVLSYAWDGNAFPGNEYWLGSLSGSGDPAAACMSTISELHNPIVNPDLLSRVKVLE